MPMEYNNTKTKAWFVKIKLHGNERSAIKLPATINTIDNKKYIIWPINNEIYFSPLIMLYMTSYSLGMLARYFAFHWMSAIRKEKGDLVYPLILAAISAIETQYPILISKELECSRYVDRLG
jgi:hypothetical protein